MPGVRRAASTPPRRKLPASSEQELVEMGYRDYLQVWRRLGGWQWALLKKSRPVRACIAAKFSAGLSPPPPPFQRVSPSHPRPLPVAVPAAAADGQPGEPDVRDL